MKEIFLDIQVGDKVIVYDEYSHDYCEHILRVDVIEWDKEYITETNPQGMHCYGTDLEEEEWGDDYITQVTEGNFCRIVVELECPNGGDETNDCADCIYSCDYHFVNGECVRREENE
jgi:hypothetical protein